MHKMLWGKIKELELRQEDLKKEAEDRSAIDLLKEQKFELDEMLESAFDAVVSMDLEGRVVFWNRRAEEIFGWDRYEVLGNALSDFIIPQEYRTRHSQSLTNYLETGKSRILNKRVEITALRKDGGSFPVELAVTPIVRSKKVIFTAFIRDMTAQKNAEQAMIDARFQAEEASKSKSRFLANMSHEIRTPLNGILGFADLLDNTKLNEEQTGYLEIIQNSGRSLLGLLSDILDLSRIEQGKMELRPAPTEFAAEVKKVAESFSNSAQSKGLDYRIQIDEDVPRNLKVDILRYNQVLSNLLNNAIKFTDSGSILFSLKTLEKTKGKALVRCSVSDTGSGVGEEAKEELFGSFVQGRNEFSGVLEGVGLGLAISKEIVSLMQGHIDFSSPSEVFDKGSDFWFDVELDLSEKEDALLNENKSPELDGFKVLLVEDNTVNRMLFARMLHDLNCEIVEAVDGIQALEIVEKSDFDLILMDVQMSRMDGWK